MADFLESEWKRDGHLVRRAGNNLWIMNDLFDPGRPTLLLNSHIDTVKPVSGWTHEPFQPEETEDDVLFGLGSNDAGASVVSLYATFCLLAQKEQPYNLIFLASAEEEVSGKNGIESVLPMLPPITFAIVGEPTGMRLGIAQKGCLWLEISAKGFTSHGAYPKEGANAVSCAVRIADQVKAFVEQTEHSLLGSSTAQITMIDGGVANNMTPDQCRVVMDIRMVPGLTSEQVVAKAKETLAQLQKEDPRFDASFRALNDRRAIEIDAGHPMTEGLGRQIKEAGYEGALLGLNFFTDASVLDRKGERDILLFGPGEPSMAHQPNEYVEIKKYEDAIRILQNFAKECGQE